MKVSLNWIRFINDKYKCSADPAPDGVDDLVEKIGLQLGAVEQVIDFGQKYKGVVVAKVVSAEKHPNADKLKICWINDGGADKKVVRDNRGCIQVVCGAPNVAAGQLVAWIPPGAVVPSTIDKDPFVLESREIRGQMSNGMISSAKELAISDEHDGILVIDQPAKPGQSFAEVYNLNDHIIDIENKMFTHRPDLFGQLGIAREIAGIQQQVFKSPDWYKEDVLVSADGRSNGLKVQVKNDVPKLVPRFCAIAIKDVKVAPSPVWLQAQLSAVGIRPINNIVDLTNFFMMETAQPLHAYDYDKVKTGVLGIRLSKKGEQIELLGGKEIKLDDGAVVITDGKKPIGLGGIMGGSGTEVDDKTRNIILECANFDMNNTRKTAMVYGIYTDAAARFTKNQSPRQNKTVITKAVDDVLRIAGGRVASPLIDDKNFSNKDIVVDVTVSFINSRLGLELTSTQIKKILESVEFNVTITRDGLSVKVPFWRTDIHIPEDVVEEVGRLYGYDKLPTKLPLRNINPANQDENLSFKSQIRKIMNRAGANEALTYSFVHENLLSKSGQDKKLAFHIRNAISPELQFYRLSLTPSLLERIHQNNKLGFESFSLYELGKSHVKGVNEQDGLPAELERLAAVFTTKDTDSGAAYFTAKKHLQYLFDGLGIQRVKYQKIGDNLKPEWLQAIVPFEPTRSALVYADKDLAGIVGEPRQKVMQALKLPRQTAQFELDISVFLKHLSSVSYNPLNRFPQLDQDFCLRSESSIAYQELEDFMNKALAALTSEHSYEFSIKPIDIFQRAEDDKHKQTTWRISMWHPERTLTTEESNKVLDKLADSAKKELNAERI